MHRRQPAHPLAEPVSETEQAQLAPLSRRFAGLANGANVDDWKFVVIVIGTGLLALVITAALKLAGCL